MYIWIYTLFHYYYHHLLFVDNILLLYEVLPRLTIMIIYIFGNLYLYS